MQPKPLLAVGRDSCSGRRVTGRGSPSGEDGEEGELTDRSPSLRSPWLQVVPIWDRGGGGG